MAKALIKNEINRDLKTVWEYYNKAEHIVKWNSANENWHCIEASNDEKVGGKYFARMEAKDNSFGFDFGGIFTKFNKFDELEFMFEDERIVNVKFTKLEGDKTLIETIFDLETENSE